MGGRAAMSKGALGSNSFEILQTFGPSHLAKWHTAHDYPPEGGRRCAYGPAQRTSPGAAPARGQDTRRAVSDRDPAGAELFAVRERSCFESRQGSLFSFSRSS